MAMSLTRRLWCRTYQAVFRAALPFLPYREPALLDSVRDIAPVLAEKGVESVLLVTGPSIGRLGLTQGLQDSLAATGIACAVYDKTVANPTVANVEEAAELYRTHNCQAIIGFGGGSPMDCAKAVGARIALPQKPVDKMRGVMRVRRPLPLLIAVPTTAGSGSEATLAAVITDEKTRFKYPINDFVLIPHYAVLDASLTLGLPPSVTAQTGMDALTHAVEAYIGRSTNAFTRACASEAVRLIHDNLLDAYRDGSNLVARRNMLSASYKAGLAFTRSYVGYVHGIAHSLGGQYDTPHGLANAVILPHVLRAYGPAAEKKLAELARVAGIADALTPDATASAAFIAWIDETNAALGIPSQLDFIREEDILAMAARAGTESNPLYPVPVLWDATDLERLYREIKRPSL
jgi:alcohol dehydrogenase